MNYDGFVGVPKLDKIILSNIHINEYGILIRVN